MGRVLYRPLTSGVVQHGLPEQTHIVCCHCRHAYDEQPVAVVSNYKEPDFEVHRMACSASCAKSYVIHQGGAFRNTFLMYQRLMLIEVYGMSVDHIVQPAKSLDWIDVNGGPMTIAEWRTPDPKWVFATAFPPMVPHQILLRMEQTTAEVGLSLPFTNVMEEDGLPDEAEPDAVTMMSNLTTRNLRRPPEDLCVKTMDEFDEAYTGMNLIDENAGPFAEYLDTHAADLPTDGECDRILRARADEKRRRRKKSKRVAPAKKAAAAAAAVGGVSDDDDDGEM